MKKPAIAITLTVLAAVALIVAACGGGSGSKAAEVSAAGDIPDNQAFVTYTPVNGGYKLEAPEGWSRTQSGTGATFKDKLNGESIVLSQAASAPTAASARSAEVAMLQHTGRAVQVSSVTDVKLPSGPAVLVEYTSDSEPDAVASKQVRLENRAYLFYKDGQLATLTLWAPKGADNVDQWLRIAQSFRWA